MTHHTKPMLTLIAALKRSEVNDHMPRATWENMPGDDRLQYQNKAEMMQAAIDAARGSSDAHFVGLQSGHVVDRWRGDTIDRALIWLVWAAIVVGTVSIIGQVLLGWSL